MMKIRKQRSSIKTEKYKYCIEINTSFPNLTLDN